MRVGGGDEGPVDPQSPLWVLAGGAERARAQVCQFRFGSPGLLGAPTAGDNRAGLSHPRRQVVETRRWALGCRWAVVGSDDQLPEEFVEPSEPAVTSSRFNGAETAAFRVERLEVRG